MMGFPLGLLVGLLWVIREAGRADRLERRWRRRAEFARREYEEMRRQACRASDEAVRLGDQLLRAVVDQTAGALGESGGAVEHAVGRLRPVDAVALMQSDLEADAETLRRAVATSTQIPYYRDRGMN